MRNKLQAAGQNDRLDSLRFEEMNINLYYTRQKKPAGLGDAVSYGQGFSGDQPVVVALGDAVIESDSKNNPLLRRMIKIYEEKGPAFVVAVREVKREDVSKYGILDIEKDEEGLYDGIGIGS